MKSLTIGVFFLLFPFLLAAQSKETGEVSLILDRIEQAFRTATPATIEDLFPFALTMRLGDSLYTNASRIQALELLKGFFSAKEFLQFHWVERQKTGKLIYTSGGKRDTVYVDIELAKLQREIVLQSLNISNYPSATMFMDTHPLRR